MMLFYIAVCSIMSYCITIFNLLSCTRCYMVWNSMCRTKIVYFAVKYMLLFCMILNCISHIISNLLVSNSIISYDIKSILYHIKSNHFISCNLIYHTVFRNTWLYVFYHGVLYFSYIMFYHGILCYVWYQIINLGLVCHIFHYSLVIVLY